MPRSGPTFLFSIVVFHKAHIHTAKNINGRGEKREKDWQSEKENNDKGGWRLSVAVGHLYSALFKLVFESDQFISVSAMLLEGN